MYTVVSDVEKYEEFLPFCCKSTVLRRLAPLVGEMYYLVSHCFADCSGRSESFRRHTQNRSIPQGANRAACKAFRNASPSSASGGEERVAGYRSVVCGHVKLTPPNPLAVSTFGNQQSKFSDGARNDVLVCPGYGSTQKLFWSRQTCSTLTCFLAWTLAGIYNAPRIQRIAGIIK
eukprot:1192160-Prorocentrum_minimum.AAC.2